MLLRFRVDSEGDVSPLPVGLPKGRGVALAAPSMVWKRRSAGVRAPLIGAACTALLVAAVVRLLT